MPYRIIKKIKALESSSTYLPSFGVDLEDDKTWGYFKLYRIPCPHIFGEAVQLLNTDGTKKYVIKRTFSFETSCTSHNVDSGTTTRETRLLHMPQDLVQGYGTDENMAIELLLREVVYGEGKKTPIYENVLVIGPMDIIPKEENTEGRDISKTANSKPEIIVVVDFKNKIAKIQSLMVLVSTGKAVMTERSKEYEQLYLELEGYTRHFGFENPNPFNNLNEFYDYYRMKFPSYQERRDYIKNLYRKLENSVSSLKKSENRKYSSIKEDTGTE
ncbi:MAG: hypothetical protein QG670_1917 [Thermoproteota archaeon]|nr:hypothetical protein [Thermoproteota archaeon]